MRKILRRPRARSFIAAAAVAGGLVLTMATPAHADYNSPLYPTLKACNDARPKSYSPWTVPQQYHKMYDRKGEEVLG